MLRHKKVHRNDKSNREAITKGRNAKGWRADIHNDFKVRWYYRRVSKAQECVAGQFSMNPFICPHTNCFSLLVFIFFFITILLGTHWNGNFLISFSLLVRFDISFSMVDHRFILWRLKHALKQKTKKKFIQTNTQ